MVTKEDFERVRKQQRVINELFKSLEVNASKLFPFPNYAKRVVYLSWYNLFSAPLIDVKSGTLKTGWNMFSEKFNIDNINKIPLLNLTKYKDDEKRDELKEFLKLEYMQFFDPTGTRYTVEEGLRTYIYADPFFRRSYKAAKKSVKGKSPKSFDDFLDSDFNLFSIFE